MRSATASDLTEMLKGLARNYPATRRGGDAVQAAEDWMDYLTGKPIGAVILAYDAQIRCGDEFMPSIGKFLKRVEDNAETITRKISTLKQALGARHD